MTTQEPARPYTVVVGVSDSSKSPVALVWAVEQAQERGGQVIAVRAQRVNATGPGARPALSRDQAGERALGLEELRADVESVLGTGHQVECRVEHGGRLKTLVSASEGADLLVIDAPRPTNLLAGPLFAHRMVYRASCPVVVMPPGISGEPSTWLERVARSVGDNALFAAGTSGRPGISMPHHTDRD